MIMFIITDAEGSKVENVNIKRHRSASASINKLHPVREIIQYFLRMVSYVFKILCYNSFNI